MAGIPDHGPRILGLSVWFFVTTPGLAADPRPPPEPLSLRQALSYAEGHPRSRITYEQRLQFPRSQPVYLTCHTLAYGSTTGVDTRRDSTIDTMIEPVVAQRLEILQRFFDVLLSDTAFARYDEATAVAYVQYDRAKARQELGEYSELQVAELDANFHDLRRRRLASELSQRLTRMLLADAIGIPEHIPRDLASTPLSKPPSNELPDLGESVAGAVQGNLWLRNLKARTDQDQQRLGDMALRRQVQELVLRLEGLKSAEQYAVVESFRSDLKLDEARVQYELEFKADLGYSMSQQTLSRLLEQRIAYCQALAWAELNALQGKPVWPGMEQE